jgi:hypothetical protein
MMNKAMRQFLQHGFGVLPSSQGCARSFGELLSQLLMLGWGAVTGGPTLDRHETIAHVAERVL